MQTRNPSPWCWLCVLACASGCTLLVDAAIDEKPVHQPNERDLDAGSGPDGGDGVRDSSTMADRIAPEGDDGSTSASPDGGAGEDGGSQTDGGTSLSGAGKISIGFSHACGIDAAGKATCWGANAENQRTLPTNRTYRDVACGDYHSCGIDTSGVLVCVGRNRDGQRVTESGPFTQVTAGDAHTCALDAAGAARCWGATSQGQSAPPSETYRSLSAGSGFTCGIRTADGTLACWGTGAAAFTNQAAGKKLSSIEAGPDYVCGVTEAGEGLCWGQRDYAAPPLDEVQQIAAGAYSGCALLADGSIKCWYGGNTEEIGADRAPFSAVAVGGTGRCGVSKAGGVYCEPEDESALVPGPDNFP